MFRCYSYTIIRERIYLCLLKLQLLKQSIKIRRVCDSYGGGVAAFPNSVYCRTVQHTDTSKGKSSQFRYNSLRFENSIITVSDTLLFITDPIYAATPPPY